MTILDVALTLATSDMPDWYTIERAEHDNRFWAEPIPEFPGSQRLMFSGRISDADVEGTAAEMLEIAKAIFVYGAYSAKRCAVECGVGVFKFWSPRNSQEYATVVNQRAIDLAGEILAKLGFGYEGKAQ